MRNGQRTTQDLELDLISRYLLGELPDDQLTLVEERYFTDPSFLQQVETVEDDLIDAYIKQEMSSLEREHFETHFLASPGRRERVALAGALMERLTQRNLAPDTSPRSPSLIDDRFGRHARLPWSRIAAAAALIVVLIAGVLLFLQNSSLRRQIQGLQVELQQIERSRQELEQALADERSANDSRAGNRDQPSTDSPLPETAPLIASFILTPGNPRSNGSQKEIRLTRPGGTIRLDLVVDSSDNYKSARALLMRAGNQEIWSRRRLPVRRVQDTNVVSLLVPARLLEPGEYTITLMTDAETSREEVIADYSFHVPPSQKTTSSKKL